MHAQAAIWAKLGRHLLQRDNDKEVRKDFPVRYHSLSESCKRCIGPTSRYCHHLLSRQHRQPPSLCATLSDPAAPQSISPLKYTYRFRTPCNHGSCSSFILEIYSVLTHSERDSERLPAGPDIYTELIFWWVCHRLWSLFGGRCLCLSALSTLWWGGPCSQQGCQIQGCEIRKHQRSHSWESFLFDSWDGQGFILG